VGEPPRADRSKKRRALRGEVDGTSWGGRGNELANTASQPARMGYVAGRWGRVPELHVVGEWYRGVRVGPRERVGPACVTGGRGVLGAVGHRRGPGATPRGRGMGPIQSAGRHGQPLWGEDRGGVGAASVAGTLPGDRAGPPSSGSSRDGRGLHVTRRGGCVAVGGSAVGRGVAPQLWTAHPRGPP